LFPYLRVSCYLTSLTTFSYYKKTVGAVVSFNLASSLILGLILKVSVYLKITKKVPITKMTAIAIKMIN